MQTLFYFYFCIFQVSDLLLKDNRTFGLDLPSFNVKRGRDFGIGSYNDFRELCGLKRAYSWKDFYDVMDPEVSSSPISFPPLCPV